MIIIDRFQSLTTISITSADNDFVDEALMSRRDGIRMTKLLPPLFLMMSDCGPIGTVE